MSAPTREEPTTRALRGQASWHDSVTRWLRAVLLATEFSALFFEAGVKAGLGAQHWADIDEDALGTDVDARS